MFETILRAARIRAFKKGRWTQDLLGKARQAAIVNPGNRERLHYLNLHRAIQPFDNAAITALPEWVTKENSTSALHLNAAIASIFQSLGYNEQARELTEAFPDKRIRLLAGYPYLLSLISPKRCLSAGDLNLVNLAKEFVPRIEPVEGFFRSSNYKSVAVVGNSPQSKGSSCGAEIDSADCVIRFNNAVTDDIFTHDYGSKTDLRIVSPGFDFDSHRSESSDRKTRENIAVSGYEPFSRKGLYWQKIARHDPARVLFFPTSAWHRLVSTLNAPPTAGLLCLQSLEMAEIEYSAFGFSKIYDETQDNHYADKHPRSSRHNWQAEAALISSLA